MANQPPPSSGREAASSRSPASGTGGGEAVPASHLLAAVEQLFLTFPIARSRPVAEGAPPGIRAPIIAGRVFSLPTPAPVSQEEMHARFLELVDPLYVRRERAAGEKVAEGDDLEVTWQGTVEGRKEPFAREENVPFRAAPVDEIPGMFEALAGQQVGGQVKLTAQLGDDYPFDAARGKKATFELQIHRAIERTPPDTEAPEFFQALGMGNTLEAVMEAIGKQLIAEREASFAEEGQQMVLGALAGEVETIIPDEWLEMELRDQWKSAQALAEITGEKMEALDVWRADTAVKAAAEQRIKLDLALQAICARDKVAKVGDADVAKLAKNLAETTGVSEAELRKVVDKDARAPAALKKAAWFMKALEHVLGHVRVETRSEAK